MAIEDWSREAPYASLFRRRRNHRGRGVRYAYLKMEASGVAVPSSPYGCGKALVRATDRARAPIDNRPASAFS